jgi:hypothetical protein
MDPKSGTRIFPSAPTPEGAPAWVRGLYASLAEAMAVLPVPPDEAIPPG